MDAAFAVLDRRLIPADAAPVALALSGGGDSMALLLIASAWAERRDRRLLALTVDHRLHPDSAAWTRFAAAAASRAGADWRRLAWSGPKPVTGLPAAARAARHALLAEVARAAGARAILMAHTLDDVLEGEAMRAGDAPRIGRLREWSPSPAWPEGREVFLLRPLLGARRNGLRAFLRGEGADWLEDPANADLRFARPRARLALAKATAAAPPASPAPVPTGAARQVASTPDGRLLLPRAALREIEDARAIGLLSILILCASGRSDPVRGASLHRLLARAKAGPVGAVSLGGARIGIGAETLDFGRETGEWRRSGPPAPLPLRAGGTAIWDGRFEIEADTDGEILAAPGLRGALSETDRAALARLPVAARAALPLFRHAHSLSVPCPLGNGPARVRALALPRFEAAAGLIEDESGAARRMALRPRSSYVERLRTSVALPLQSGPAPCWIPDGP